MGLRGEVFSTRIFVDEGRKTYFFNIKENRNSDLYLNIVESRRDGDRFKRSSLVVFEEDLDIFLESFHESIAVFREHRPLNRDVPVGIGRRVYTYRNAFGKRPALELVETRSDETGRKRQSLRIASNAVEPFLSGLDKAVRRLKSLILSPSSGQSYNKPN